MVEIDFWESRARNLECIFDQLRSPKVRKMAEILERTESSYFNAFKILFQDVVNGKILCRSLYNKLDRLNNFQMGVML